MFKKASHPEDFSRWNMLTRPHQSQTLQRSVHRLYGGKLHRRMSWEDAGDARYWAELKLNVCKKNTHRYVGIISSSTHPLETIG